MLPISSLNSAYPAYMLPIRIQRKSCLSRLHAAYIEPKSCLPCLRAAYIHRKSCLSCLHAAYIQPKSFLRILPTCPGKKLAKGAGCKSSISYFFSGPSSLTASNQRKCNKNLKKIANDFDGVQKRIPPSPTQSRPVPSRPATRAESSATASPQSAVIYVSHCP